MPHLQPNNSNVSLLRANVFLLLLLQDTCPKSLGKVF